MSKRHQANRRKTYGRRLHEMRERPDQRQQHADGAEPELEWGQSAPPDPLAFLDSRGPRLRFSSAD